MSTNPADLIGHTIDQYQIVRHIDRGGMADVYQARDQKLGRAVAIKILLPALVADEQFVIRFKREARTAARLEHPHIVPIYGIGTTGVNQPYIAMQYVEGGDLKSKIKQMRQERRPFPVRQALNILRPIADALRVAHAAGVVHRDIKPSNILIRPDGTPVLVDMGIAAVKTGEKLTSTGTRIGTPSYMSPEQAAGRPLDGRADIYSLGIILYEMLAGRLPFEADEAMAVMHKHVYEQPQPLEQLRSGLSPAVVSLVHACLRKDPQLRPQTAADLIRGMDNALAVETGVSDGRSWRPPDRTEVLQDPLEGLDSHENGSSKRPEENPYRKWVIPLVLLLLVFCFTTAGLLLIPASPLSIAALFADGEVEPPPDEDEDEDEEEADEENNDEHEDPETAAEIEVGTEEETVVVVTGDPTVTPVILIATVTPSPTTEPTVTSAPTAVPTETPTSLPYPLVETIGSSVNNLSLVAYQFGNGPNVIVFIGGIHAGASPGSVALANQAIEWFTNNPGQIPEQATIIILPNMNPDAPYAPGDLSGRLNANGVDLNRNWDCEWVRDARWRNNVVPGSGGPSPFSEPETEAARDYLLQLSPRAVVFWQARATNGLSSPGACGSRTAVSSDLATTYGRAAGYTVADFENLTSQIVNGDGTNWLDAQGIPAIAVLLPEYETTDWTSNMFGIQAVLREYGQ